jgi:hypothetical protein
MSNAAKHMVQQRPGISKQDQATEDRIDERAHRSVGIWSACRSEQPPGDQQGSEIKGGAGDAMGYRHQHRQHRLVDEKGRERPLDRA